MQAEKLAHWSQVVGNFGLIACLVLVAVQIRQNTAATEAQLTSDAMSNRNQLQIAILGEHAADALAKALDDPGALTTSELIVL